MDGLPLVAASARRDFVLFLSFPLKPSQISLLSSLPESRKDLVVGTSLLGPLDRVVSFSLLQVPFLPSMPIGRRMEWCRSTSCLLRVLRRSPARPRFLFLLLQAFQALSRVYVLRPRVAVLERVLDEVSFSS